MDDDRITCHDCTKLRPNKVCGAAATRERIDVGPRYVSIWINDPHRCLWFDPAAHVTDRRPGTVRFAELREGYERNRAKVDPWAAALAGIEKAKRAIA